MNRRPATASVPNLLSRGLLALEVLVIVVPVLVVAFLLAAMLYFFVILGTWVVVAGPDRSMLPMFVVIVLSALLCLAYLLTVMNVSVRYIGWGRAGLATVSRLEWVLMVLGAMVFPAWCLALHGEFFPASTRDVPVLFLPSAVLVVPLLHLLLASEMAHYRAPNGIWRIPLWPGQR